MKASHYTTPRTLTEAHFDCRGQALFGFESQSGRHWADWVLVVIALGAAVALLKGWL